MTVLAIMAKAPRAGRVKTRLSPPLSPAGAAALAHGFLADTVRRVAQVDGARRAVLYAPRGARPFFERIAPGFRLIPQAAGDLGHRLHAGFARLLERDAPAAVVIGSDTPSLPLPILEQAVRALHDRRTDVVLGPSEDGGYYLIGMRTVHAALFEGIGWSTSSVLEQTLARARELRVSILTPWWDIDTPADLGRLRRWLDLRPPGELPETRRALVRVQPHDGRPHPKRRRERQKGGKFRMTFTSTTPLVLAGLLAVAPAAMARTHDEIQAPRGQEIQAPRGEEIQAPRGQEIQAPRGDGYGPDVPTLRR